MSPMTPRLSEETGRVLGGRYRLVAPIGVGTSSRVFLAVDTQLRRQVAVKLLHEALAEDEAFLRRFRAEARAAGALNHPNIVAVFDWGEDHGEGGVVPYLVTEYLGGGSLRDMLDRTPLLTPSQTLLVGLDAARALAHAHLRGLVHRDVKPGNLLFDDEARLRLADFGLARALAEASWTEPTGTAVGTARYASPEQALGRRLDGRSDVYSLALVLVECLTGQVPFVADTTTATLALRTQGDLELGPELGGLRSVLERAGRLDPAERPEAAEFEIALMATAEEYERPERLPIVPTLGDGQQTSEMLLVTEIGAITGLDDDAAPIAHRDPQVVLPPPPEVIGDEPDDVSPAPLGVPATTNGTLVTSPLVADAPLAAADVEGDGAGNAGTAAAILAEDAGADDAVDPDAAADAPAAPVGRIASEPSDTIAAEPVEATPASGVAVTAAGAAAVATSRRDPITVAQEHELLSGSRPASFGKVEPYGVDAAPTIAPPTGRQQRKAERHAARSERAAQKASAKAARPRRRWPRRVMAVLVALALIGGAAAGWWFLVRVPVHDVPDFSTMNVEQATTEAERLGWDVDADTVDRRDGTEPGDVLEQVPASGTELAEGETVTFTVSLGATLTAVPDVAGTAEADARRALESQGLVVGTVTPAFDEGVPTGQVVSATPAPGSPAVDDRGQLPKGTVVDLVVSEGPAPRVVPDGLQGMSQAEAEAALAEVQLVAAINPQYNETVAEGVVVSASSAAGTELPRDAEVTLEVSRGPAPIVVPDVRYVTGSMAAQQLEQAGFSVSGIEGSPSGMVLATDPPAGEQHPRGTAVRIFTRS